MNPNQPQPKVDNPLEVMSAGEQNICEIKRHPFGLFGMYIGSGILIILVLVAAFLIPHFVSGLSGSAQTGVVLGGLVLAVLILLYDYIAVTIYKGNRWVVTSDSITQIRQVGLFRKQTSQLSLANLEDVTFEQNGLVQSMFHFGDLKVETAGEHSKFIFPFCPQPAEYARQIIKAHEDYLAYHPEESQRGQTGLTNAQFAQPAYAQQPPATPQPYQPPAQQAPYQAPPYPTEQPPAGPPTQPE